MRTPSPRSAVAAVAVALAAAGCGGGDSPQEVARDFLATNGPEKCRLVLPELLERQTGERGEAAVRFCERNVGRTPPAREIRVVESEVRDGKATVEVIADDREDRLVLVKRDGEWRIADFPR